MSLLSTDVLFLLQQIEQDKSGWFDSVAEAFALLALRLADRPMTPGEVRNTLTTELGTPFSATQIRRALGRLTREGRTVKRRGTYVLSQQAVDDYDQAIASAEAFIDSVRKRFDDLVTTHAPGLDPGRAWEHFHTSLLEPLVKDTGAQVWEMVADGHTKMASKPVFQSYLGSYDSERQLQITAIIGEFFDPNDPLARSYILRCISSCFILNISSSASNLELIDAKLGKTIEYVLVLDTNFIFSLLGFHSDIPREAAQSLMEMLRMARTGVTFQLWVSPMSIREARGVLGAAADSFAGVVLDSQIAEVASESGLEGLALRFAESASKSGYGLTIEQFLRPYLDDLPEILATYGISVSAETGDEYRVRQDVVDDNLGELESDKAKRGERAKSYSAMQHDMVLWHWVTDLRPRSVASPLDAKYWIVTVDFGFLDFDRRKSRSKAKSVPVCVHPVTLSQLLQFWVPRSEQFERTVVDNLRLPIFVQDFDSQTERLSLRILRAVSRFEKTGDLPESVLRSVLLNQALRLRMASARDEEEELALVETALLDELRRLQQELESAKESESRAQDEGTKIAAQIEELEQKLSAKERELESLNASVGDQYEKWNLELESRLAQTEQAASEEVEEAKRAKDVSEFKAWALSSLVVGSVVVLAASTYVAGLAGARHPGQVTLTMVGVFWLIWVFWIDHEGGRNTDLRVWRGWRVIHGARIVLFALLSAMILGAASNAAWQWSPAAWDWFAGLF